MESGSRTHKVLEGRGDGFREPARPDERTYYRQFGVQVTARWLVVGPRRYALAELGDLWTVRGSLGPAVRGARWVTWAAAAVLFAVVVSFPLFPPDSVAWLGAIVVSMIVCGLAALRLLQPRPYEMWAQYRGEEVRIYRAADEKTYGHVCRALIRAREYLRHQELRHRLVGAPPAA